MTLEQIVNTHPCPIIRAKIMENVDRTKKYDNLRILLLYGFIWESTKEGEPFWESATDDLDATYSDLKHLDNSYVPEPAKPAVMWRKIDKDNLPKEKVATIDIAAPDNVHTGNLYSEDLDFNTYGAYLGNTGYGIVLGMTHYIPLSDLINLPIEP